MRKKSNGVKARNKKRGMVGGDSKNKEGQNEDKMTVLERGGRGGGKFNDKLRIIWGWREALGAFGSMQSMEACESGQGK